MQDGWILAQAIAHFRSSPQLLASALAAFDTIRSPYYHRMFVDLLPLFKFSCGIITDLVCEFCRYEHLDQQGKKIQDAKANNPQQTFEEGLDVKVKAFGGGDTLSWIYQNDIQDAWEQFVDAEKNA
jgi:salicylate hydroxylase